MLPYLALGHIRYDANFPGLQPVLRDSISKCGKTNDLPLRFSTVDN